jgi:hypothetical protein
MIPAFWNRGSRLNLLRYRSTTIPCGDPFKIRVFTFRAAIKGDYRRIDRAESDNEITFTWPLRNPQATSRSANFPGRLSMNQFTIGASQRPANDIFYASWKKDKKEASIRDERRRAGKEVARSNSFPSVPKHRTCWTWTSDFAVHKIHCRYGPDRWLSTSDQEREQKGLYRKRIGWTACDPSLCIFSWSHGADAINERRRNSGMEYLSLLNAISCPGRLGFAGNVLARVKHRK